MLKILRSLLPDLSTYDVERRPRKDVVIEKANPIKGQVSEGREWRTEWDRDGNLNSQRVGKHVPQTAGQVVLDQYDAGLLDYVLSKKWRNDEAKAKIMKWHWLREESAAQIQKYHTVGGNLEKGYSERIASDYTKAFYAADDKREEDGKERQRAAPAGNAKEISWD